MLFLNVSPYRVIQTTSFLLLFVFLTLFTIITQLFSIVRL